MKPNTRPAGIATPKKKATNAAASTNAGIETKSLTPRADPTAALLTSTVLVEGSTVTPNVSGLVVEVVVIPEMSPLEADLGIRACVATTFVRNRSTSAGDGSADGNANDAYCTVRRSVLTSSKSGGTTTNPNARMPAPATATPVVNLRRTPGNEPGATDVPA